MAAGLSSDEIIEELPDLEKEDILAALKYASRKLNHPVIAAWSSGQKRYEAKLRLSRILYQRHWDKQRIIDLFCVVDWLMQLPEWLNN